MMQDDALQDEFADLAHFTFVSVTKALAEYKLDGPALDGALRQLPNTIAMTFSMYWRAKQAQARARAHAA